MGNRLLLCSRTAAVVALKASLSQSNILIESCFPHAMEIYLAYVDLMYQHSRFLCITFVSTAVHVFALILL